MKTLHIRFIQLWADAYREQRSQKWIAANLNVSVHYVHRLAHSLRAKGVWLPRLSPRVDLSTEELILAAFRALPVHTQAALRRAARREVLAEARTLGSIRRAARALPEGAKPPAALSRVQATPLAAQSDDRSDAGSVVGASQGVLETLGKSAYMARRKALVAKNDTRGVDGRKKHKRDRLGK